MTRRYTGDRRFDPISWSIIAVWLLALVFWGGLIYGFIHLVAGCR